jgi:hypothetical protein
MCECVYCVVEGGTVYVRVLYCGRVSTASLAASDRDLAATTVTLLEARNEVSCGIEIAIRRLKTDVLLTSKRDLRLDLRDKISG